MPKIRTSRSKPPPVGFDEIEQTLLEIQSKMREAETQPHEGKRKCETLWPVIRVNHQRSKYVYDLYYKEGSISRELYDYLIKEGWADGSLIAKWKKVGYDKLCCLQCASTEGHTHGGVCICRVPRKDLPDDKVIECQTCGCRGCASSD